MSLLSQQYEAFTADSPDNLALLIDSTIQYHKGYISEHKLWWSNMQDSEIDSLCIEHLMNYDGEERDLIWWSGRLRLANELDQQCKTLYYIPF